MRKVSRVSLVAVLTVLSSGCVLIDRSVVLHPITPMDIFVVPTGTKINDNLTIKPGFFLSSEYLDKVAKVKVKQ